MVQIALYYLKNLSKHFIKFLLLIIIITSFSYIYYENFVKKVSSTDLLIDIPKNSNLNDISNIIKNNSLTRYNIFPFSISLILGYEKKLNYGEYLITNRDTLFSVIKKIRYGNVYNRKITIIEGYENYQLLKLIDSSLLVKDDFKISNYDLIGETFSYNKYQTVSSFLKKISVFTNNFLNNQKNLNNYTNKEILIISSLVEKEAMDESDKKLVSSVIFNRLRNNMKLDIDASVIFSITNGEYKFMRSLNYKDLKIDSIFNTYRNKGLPPHPICIPGLNTVKIVLENYKSPYLYYFFDNNKKSHVFSENYEEHTNNLNEYRKNKK